ncbi:MAG: hypothetical protein ACF8LK_08860 [Phycisphaerales bacterium JB041]
MPAPSRCPTADVNRYRLAETPTIVNLLEHLPGDVPYSTHLELEAVRARLVDHAVGEALRRLDAGVQGEKAQDRGADFGAVAAADSGTPGGAAEPERAVAGKLRRPATGSAERLRVVTAYTMVRRAWPAGGLIDLVI